MAIRTVKNERELLLKVEQGDETAFAELFFAYHNQLGQYVLMLTGSEEMTEEIVQDVFVKVWMNRAALLTINKFTSYLFILTRNYTLNCIRKRLNERKQQENYNQSVLTDPILSEEDELILDPDYQSLVDKAVAQLPPQQQKVFILRQQGLKNPQIAEKMEISTDSVKKYQQWALKAVSEFVKSHAALSLFFILIKK
ncbi:RNA polymerase sigma factor [Pedobacter nyackensis]|uniref:RNA polymerase sigma-70 factor, ECF subfamily n=1 Tax=Pedobacter nyackensis TaxID=475255 RepID=A0A1W2B112_9SPHI|nr:sigma-70 family RNA polymerase sigma factor [Pedobacter nyackensis]SMC66412.1 RNA polymerase sigma-70 factor, ECF subfamily [Pedobacter nyackensis]